MEYLALNNGVRMPLVGFGTWTLRGETGKRCILDALETGYRLLDTAQMYENENRQYQKELEKLKQEEQEQQAAVNITKVWLNNFSRRKLTIKQLTREVLVELIDKIYVYPDQKIDIYFKFASEKNSVDVTVQKDGVI